MQRSSALLYGLSLSLVLCLVVAPDAATAVIVLVAGLLVILLAAVFARGRRP
jgi:hypothetical protein